MEEPVYCEALYADRHYLKKRNLSNLPAETNLVFMSGWHRQPLCLTETMPGEVVSLDITIGRFPRSLLWQIRAGVKHPQLIVFLATVLGLIGVGLGLMGLGLALVALKMDILWLAGYLAECLKWFPIILEWFLVILGGVIIAWSIVLYSKR